MSHEVIAGIIWTVGFGSLLLFLIGLSLQSWLLVWVSALLSFGFSFVTGFSIGPFTFLLTCVQLALAIALRRRLSGGQGLALVAGFILLWAVIVPLQLMTGVIVLPFAFPLVPLLATIVLFASGPRERANTNG